MDQASLNENIETIIKSDQISLDENIEMLACSYVNIHTAKFDRIVSKLKISFGQNQLNSLYIKFVYAMNQMNKINTRKMLICACYVLNDCDNLKWNDAREIVSNLIGRWITANPIYNTPSVRFELDMYMPIIIGDMLNLVPKFRARWPPCFR